MNKPENFQVPFYIKTTVLLIGFFVFIAMLYIAKGIILPLLFAFIIAILLQPIVVFLSGKGINRVISIIITMILTMVVIAALGTFIFSQLSRFSESLPILLEKITTTSNEIITYASGYYDIDPVKVHNWIEKAQAELLNSSTGAIGQTLSSLSTILVALFLVPTYVFLILFYEPLLLDFVHKVFQKSHQGEVHEVVSQTKTLIQRYLVGILIEATIIAILQSVTLFIFGIEYAILLGILGALLNMVPYIGGFVAVSLPMIVALVTKSNPMIAIYILIIYYIIQLIDNNYIVPKIVASKVKINALFSIIVVIAANVLWGIPGMIISIPLLAIVKLIFDHIEPLKPWGFLLGDTMPSLLEISPLIKKIKKIL